jgi:ribosome biogenesis GTPase A
MVKYNISEIKEKEANYRGLVSPQLMDKIQEKIMKIIVMDKKYRDKDYSAKNLAEEIGTNTRYISAVVNTRFHMNSSPTKLGQNRPKQTLNQIA